MIRFHRADHAQIINAAGHVREERTDFSAGFAMGCELPLGSLEKHFEVPFTALILVDGGRLAHVGKEFWFRVPRVNVRDAAAHVQKNHASGFRREMRRLGGQGVNVEDGRGFLGQQLRHESG